MPQQRRQGTIRHAGIGVPTGVGSTVALLIGVLTLLTACAGPGGDGLSTISAGSTVGGAVTTTTPGSTRTASTGSAVASTGTTVRNTVVASAGSAAASPNAAGSAAASTGSRPAGVGSVPAAVGSAVSTGSQTAGVGSAASGTRPATTGSMTPGVASATRPATTGSATTATGAGAGTATRAGSATASRAAGTTVASTGSATIPPPPSGVEYVKGTNAIIDTILQGASEGLNSSSDTVTVTSTKNYTSPSSAADVVAFYGTQMPMLGWTAEQNQAASSGITTLVYSRDNQTNAALLLVVDLAQVGQKGCLVITALAKPK